MAKLWDRLRRRFGGGDEQGRIAGSVQTQVAGTQAPAQAPISETPVDGAHVPAPSDTTPALPAAWPTLAQPVPASQSSQAVVPGWWTLPADPPREHAPLPVVLPPELAPLVPDLLPTSDAVSAPAAGDTSAGEEEEARDGASETPKLMVGETLAELADHAIVEDVAEADEVEDSSTAPENSALGQDQAQVGDADDAGQPERVTFGEVVGEDEPAGGLGDEAYAGMEVDRGDEPDEDELDGDEPAPADGEWVAATQAALGTGKRRRERRVEPDELDGQPARLVLPGRPLKRNEVPTLETPLLVWSHDASGAVVVRPTLYACVQTQWYGSSLYFLVIPWDERDAPERSARLVVDATQLRVAPAGMLE